MNYADKRVLIIEDQRPFLLLLRGLLNSMGCTDVVTKSSAEQALALCAKQKFDIIIADLHLGAERKNGFELVEELRIRQLIKPSSIFMLISADSARPVVLGSVERRPDDYLIKPFSQVQLKNRLNRAWQKRQALLPIYSAINAEQPQIAIDACHSIIQANTNYQHSAEQLLVELYWQEAQYQQALEVIKPYEQGQNAQWVKTALARTYLQLGKAETAIALCDQILMKNRFSAEAYDIIAHARQAINDGEAAIAAINQAIKLSPYSLPRYYSACDIARLNKDYMLASQACLAIWDLSKRTVHQNIAHWCGYIRSMLDVAEYTEDKRTRNRYQQDALLQLQRGRFDEAVARMSGDFNYDIYEQVVLARIATLDGKKLDAKRALFQSQQSIDAGYESYPLYYAPDSLKVMLELGEYEDAQPLAELLSLHRDSLDPNTSHAVELASAKATDKQSAYLQFNRQGISLYQQNKFAEARMAFTQAQDYAPVNTGVALNLMQCILKLAAPHKNPPRELSVECKRLCRLIDDVPLKPQHQEKYAALREEINELMIEPIVKRR
ncbi:response regulator [Salinimonas sediminis]|uniref:Response regulator n=1 Tax=Salinimonas sediminis TaxID=2303538 RepID=A0A346NLX8_9ALTE|nr:response regulator [Salinimonas sediminis]AXR06535.1 response regulator [Salinimonas sediminis]